MGVQFERVGPLKLSTILLKAQVLRMSGGTGHPTKHVVQGQIWGGTYASLRSPHMICKMVLNGFLLMKKKPWNTPVYFSAIRWYVTKCNIYLIRNLQTTKDWGC